MECYEEYLYKTNSFNENEKNIFLLINIYLISGYENVNNYNNKDVMKGICDNLNISRSKYMLNRLSMIIKSYKIDSIASKNNVKKKVIK